MQTSQTVFAEGDDGTSGLGSRPAGADHPAVDGSIYCYLVIGKVAIDRVTRTN